MFTSETFLKEGLSNVRVGIGRGTNTENVERSIHVAGCDNVFVYDDEQKLVDDLVSGKIDAAVRGDMSSSKLLPILKKELNVDSLERLVLLEPPGGKLVFLAPVGIDEGWTIAGKFDLAVKSLELMKKLGAGQKVAVMSGGRIDDFGRNPAVDKTLKDAAELVRMLKDAGYDAYDAQILIEDAVDEGDLIIAPDGITGNIIFRALHFIGQAKSLGAPVLNTDKIFIDTSRVKVDYTDSIQLAIKLAEVKK
jgi:putative methanogen marker protein 4